MRLLWILALPVGILCIVYTEWLLENFGRIDWAEEKLGTEGGTRLFWKLFGLFLIIISLLGISGALGGIVMGIFGGIFRGSVPGE